MKKKLLFYNTFTGIIYQIIAIICGFILPRVILNQYGSSVNGLVNSINQFLGFISLAELGVGAVVESSLYKPLALHNQDQLNAIISSATKFYRLIGRILLAYVIILLFVYPRFTSKEFSYEYSASLLLIISISFFLQYFFSIVDGIFLRANQHGYVYYTIQSICVILNTFVCSILAINGFGIHFIKSISALIFILRPFALRTYINKNYHINRGVKYEKDPIAQKWNGIAQHFSSVILDDTDVIVLTLFSSLSNVSIYSVYYMVVNGVKQVITSMTGGIQAFWGELFAKKEQEELNKSFLYTEWLLHSFSTLVFSCTFVLIVPFILIYTKNINDANYFQPIFSGTLVVANYMHCLRMPYHVSILAANKYRDTQKCFIIAAIINIIISIAVVRRYGIVGVAIGTLVSMLYQTIWMALYNKRKLIKRSTKSLISIFTMDISCFVIIALVGKLILIKRLSWMSWIINAFIILALSFVIIFIMNYIFYHNYELILIQTLKHKIRNGKA